jgi:hypothetical protein
MASEAKGEEAVSVPRPADLGKLLPSVRPVMQRMRALLEQRGFKAVPRGTVRTRKQAHANTERGTGIDDSMHCYRIAVDWVCGEHGWDCAKYECRFFAAVGEVSESLGLTWGGRWIHREGGPDWPHTQAITVAEQHAFRELTSDEERDAFVRRSLARHCALHA